MQSYEYETQPYEHQRTAFEESWDAEFYALLMEMGTGKSKVAIDTMGALYEKGKIKAALIVAPKGVYDNWVKVKYQYICQSASPVTLCDGFPQRPSVLRLI